MTFTQGIVDQKLGNLAQERDQLQQEQSNLQNALTHLARGLASQQQQWRNQRLDLEAQLTTAQQTYTLLQTREQRRHSARVTRLEAIQKERQVQQKKQKEAGQVIQASEAALLASKARRAACEQELQIKRQELMDFHASSALIRLVSRLLGVTEQSLLTEVEHGQAELEQAKQTVTTQEQEQATAYRTILKANTQLLLLDKEEQTLRKDQQQITPDAKQLQALTAQIEQDERCLSKGDISIFHLEEELQHKERIYRRMQQRLQKIEEEQRSITAWVISEARLIGTTLTGVTTNPYLRNRTFDTTIIDEASMASLASVLVAAAHATRHVVLIGDPMQLAPIVQLKDKQQAPLAAYWLGTDLFSHLGITLKDADTEAHQVVLLSHQSRMLPEIAAPLSRWIYEDRLNHRDTAQRNPLRLQPHPEWPLLLVDTGDVDRRKGKGESRICVAKRPLRSASKYNLYHVECVVQLVHLLLSQLPKMEEPQIGVITPYNAQKIRIRNALQRHDLLRRVHVGTIHSFQSVEYPCIIFDTVEGWGVPIQQFTSNSWGRHGIAHDATRLINVAHSRARDKLIYLAHAEYIRHDTYRKGHLLTRFVNYAYEQGYVGSSALFSQAT